VTYNFQVDKENNFYTRTPEAGQQGAVQTSQQAPPTETRQTEPSPPEQITYEQIAANLDEPRQPPEQSQPDVKQVLQKRYSDSPKDQKLVSRQEFQNRSANQVRLMGRDPSGTQETPSTEQPLRAMWIGEQLVLARRVSDRNLLEGAVLDWQSLREQLLEDIRRDLLPEAQLVPLGEDEVVDPTRTLASLPLKLVPGPPPVAGSSGPGRTVCIVLGTAWAAVLLAALAGALSLRGVLQLSERRADFVTAVTHELRTPLTTFRMYTEMLADGMVDESRRTRYLETLKAEADRLGHLVQNVLSYARLERTDSKRRAQAVPLGELMDRVEPRLQNRTGEAGMELVWEVPDPAGDCRVKVDPDALEHVLMNLVDNACKYAARAEDRRIHLRAEVDDDSVRLHLRDHGPGVSPEEAKRIFRPFRKSAHQAAQTAPGVGLGLALSRRLARRMGGNLALATDCPEGACFVLTLPRT
jgi:signal transduction histidine kinase